ncbi:hypothetical protein E2C01_052706 [Portunus trituberculatus]|uniref:Uncharacterized protein n=1 Tax=Portunus trituberculatus TaxID=210409 RepID=A0A5B7GM72_PORTR|nr:hypothetical protein [Portunus trituberculatus]
MFESFPLVISTARDKTRSTKCQGIIWLNATPQRSTKRLPEHKGYFGPKEDTMLCLLKGESQQRFEWYQGEETPAR